MHTQSKRHSAHGVIVAGLAVLVTLVLGQAASQPAGKAEPLAQRRVAAAKDAYELLVVDPPKRGQVRASAEDTYLWSKRWMEAEQDAAVDRPTALAAAEAHLTRMNELSQRAKTMFEAGQASDADVARANFYRTDAEWSAAKYRTN